MRSIEDFLKIQRYNTDPRLKGELDGFWKEYPSAEHMDLQADLEQVSGSFKEILLGRKSERRFSRRPIERTKLANLLRLANGTSKRERAAGDWRTAPSAGRRYPIELYASVAAVEDFPSGLYHYHPRKFRLERLPLLHPARSALGELYPGDRQMVEGGALILFLTAVFERTTRKYGERGWRMLLMEAGHLGQNLWLSANALGLGCCPLAGGYDQRVSDFLGLNPAQEAFLLAYVIGYPESS